MNNPAVCRFQACDAPANCRNTARKKSVSSVSARRCGAWNDFSTDACGKGLEIRGLKLPPNKQKGGIMRRRHFLKAAGLAPLAFRCSGNEPAPGVRPPTSAKAASARAGGAPARPDGAPLCGATAPGIARPFAAATARPFTPVQPARAGVTASAGGASVRRAWRALPGPPAG